MKHDVALDYAVFQLSPRHSRCELFVSSCGNTEKLASGLVKPFVAHLKVAEEQVAQAVHSIKLEVERHGNAGTWFTKGTLERFVRFVSTPEVLEMVNTFDAEMSQLEGARKIYSQGASHDQLSGALGGDGTETMAGADATKKELLRAIDVRLTAVMQDLTTACDRASAAGFNPETVAELQLFSDHFGAHRLNEACTKFISLCERRPDLINPQKIGVEDQVVRASWGSDMSIDDPSEESSGSHTVRSHNPFQNKHQDQQANQSKPYTFRPNSSLSSEQLIIQKENREEEKSKENSSSETLPIQPSQPARRLSVQDRINLFENKQKENSGGKLVPAVKPAELRRLSSDVSSAPALEKAVLRRWSGASDMSIDMGNDKKDDDSIDSPSCMPSSSSVSQSKSSASPDAPVDDKNHKGLTHTASSVKAEARNVSGIKDKSEFHSNVGGFVGNDNGARLKDKRIWNDQVESQAQSRSFTSRSEEVGAALGIREEMFKGTLGRDENSSAMIDQGGFMGKSKSYSDRGEEVGLNIQTELQVQSGNIAGMANDIDTGSRLEDVKIRDHPSSNLRFRSFQKHTRSLSGQFEGGYAPVVKEVPSKETEGDRLTSQLQWKSPTRELPQGGNRSAVSMKEPKNVEDLEVPSMTVQKSLSAGQQQIMKLQGGKDESGFAYENKFVFPARKASKNQGSFGNVPVPAVDQVQRVRQSKGSQELNDELKMKANELEKLFAEHKQSGSARRSKPTNFQVEQAISSQNRKPGGVEISISQLPDKKAKVESITSVSDNAKFDTPPPVKMVDHQDYSHSLRQNFSDLNFSSDSRGKSYERYMQKRDAKLREDWGTQRAEKEAKWKAMQDSLERSRAEMMARFSRSADRSISGPRQRADKLKMYRYSSIKREKNLIDSLQNEEDEDPSEYLEKCYSQDESFGEASLVDGASRSSQNNRFSLKRTLSSATPRTTAAPVPRSSTKISNPGSGRRRLQSENPLAQSVPNFSDFRKENTKPSSAASKTANRTQLRTYARSKSAAEETPVAREEKPRCSQSLRKSTACLPELKDLSLNSDDVSSPLEFDEEQSEQELYAKLSKNRESKLIHRKGNGIVPGTGTSTAKQKASVASDAQNNEGKFEETPCDADDSVNMVKEEEKEEEIEEVVETIEVDDYANNVNGIRLIQESEKLSEYENDSLRSHSQIDPSSVPELPASISSTFHAVGSFQDSPGESPVSWNSRMHNPFSYPHEISDIDASVDSPIGSPASWNFHSLTQTEADAARMRKKWGSAQKPILAANSFHSQARKDVTKGFKRLLKFGRKSRGGENLADWISATTSEGDDDTEDGRDPASRSSEDLRKSRMGFSQSHASDDILNETELFNEQDQSFNSSIPAPVTNFKLRDHMSGSSNKAPRSFFSLSTFRSKGSESKLR